jgi:hypothetical protein
MQDNKDHEDDSVPNLEDDLEFQKKLREIDSRLAALQSISSQTSETANKR